MKYGLGVYIYTTAVEAAVLANSNWGTYTHEPKETICHLVCRPSVRACFYGPGNGVPWKRLMQAQDDPITNCAHFVSLSARRCFLHRVEIWSVYYSTSRRFPLYKSLLCGAPSLPLVLFQVGRRLLHEECKRKIASAFSATPFQRCANICMCLVPLCSNAMRSQPTLSSTAPQYPSWPLYCFTMWILTSCESELHALLSPSWPRHLDGIMLRYDAQIMLPGCFEN